MRILSGVVLLAGASSLLQAGEILSHDTYGLLSGATATNYIVGAPGLASPGNINDAAGPFRFPRGIGLDGTVGIIITKASGSFLCSGAMISAGAVLSAAHCFTDNLGNNNTTSVAVTAFPNGTTTSSTLTAPGSEIYIPDAYDGSAISDFDIAIIRLGASFGAGVDIYDTFGAFDTVSRSAYTNVGFGARGAGATGATLPAGSRRRGFNNFDFFNSPGVLVSDFDNGLGGNNASCYIAGVFCTSFDLGLGAFESSTAGGDSGGPVFLGGRIVGVTSFGARIGSPPDIDGVLNSTFGEFNGFVYTGFHEDWIASVLAIPEPGTWLLCVAGLGAVAALRRRIQRG